MATRRSDTCSTSGMSCSTTTRAGAGLVADAADQRAPAASTSRWAMPEAGSSRSTTFGRWASRQARSTTRRVPVDSSPTNRRRGRAPRPSSSTSWSTRPADRVLAVDGVGQVEGGRQRVAHLDPALEGGGDGLVDGHRREQAGVLERTAEALACPARGLEVGHVAPGRGRRGPRSSGTNPLSRSNRVVLPAPLGPMTPTISPGAHVERHALDCLHPAEARRHLGHAEDRGRARAPGAAVQCPPGRGRTGLTGALARRRTGWLRPSRRPRPGWPPQPSRRPRPGGAQPAGGARRRRRTGGGAEEHRAEEVGAVEQVAGRPGEADLAPLHGTRPARRSRAPRSPTARRPRGSCPRPAARSTKCSSSPTTAGARPSDSSSIISSLGRVEHRHGQRQHLLLAARQVAGPARRPGRAARGTALDASPRSAASASRSPRRSQPATRRFSATVRVGNTPWPPGIWATPRAAITWAGWPVMSSPSITTRPASGGARPEMALSSVDLPAPLVPSRATASPPATAGRPRTAPAPRRSRPRRPARRAARRP